MTTNETITITETASDGTETVIEITTTKTDDVLAAGDGESLVEEVIEAILDENPSDDAEYLVEPETYETEPADLTSEDYSLNEEIPGDETQIDPVEVSTSPVGTDMPVETVSETPFEPVETTPFSNPVDLSSDTAITDTTASDEAERIEQENLEAHAEAARDAQEAADEFVAQGDYAAAAEAREDAENESYAAGDDSMLGAYDSSDLEAAGYKQEEAENYQQQQAAYAQQGDYEAAREAASDAAYATRDADSLAGGADHSGQARAEENQMDWAVWHEDIADYNAQSAEQYAAEGDFENAEMYSAEAVEHQEMADYHGDLGEHGGDVAVYDPSSEVDTGGSYDSTYDSTVDTSTDYSSE